MRKHIYLLLLSLYISTPLWSQSNVEQELFDAIKKIDSDVFDAEKHTMSIKPMLKQYKQLTKQVKNDNQLGAVINSKIGQALSKKHYESAAIPFLIQAYKHRKAQGEYFPQRWALRALMINGRDREDFKFVFKYAKEWVQLVKSDTTEFKKLSEKIYSEYGSPWLTYSLDDDMENVLSYIYPIKLQKYWKDRKTDYEQRRKYAYKLLEFNYKAFSHNPDAVSFSAISFYMRLIPILIEEKDIKEALYWKDKSLKLVKKYEKPEYYAEYLRYLATWFRKEKKHPRYSWRTENGMETTDYESIGIELMEEYIKVCKALPQKDQVLFGYRYIATRYTVLEDYQKSVQYLATAIKYCHEYGMEEEIRKSIGGLQVLLATIVRKRDKNGLNAAQRWKENYSLEGLTESNIEFIDSILFSRNGSSW